MSNYIYYDYMTSSVCKVKEDGIESIYSTSLQSYFNQQCLLNHLYRTFAFYILLLG